MAHPPKGMNGRQLFPRFPVAHAIPALAGVREGGLARAGAAALSRRMRTHVWLFAAAGYNVALALFHLGFWRLFRWREELPKLHPVNRGVLQVVNLMLTFLFLLLAGLQVLFTAEMTGTALGRALLAGMMLFWILRAVLQPLFWRALPAATNAAFVGLFLLGAGLHALAYPS